MADLIAGAVVVVILGLALFYIIRAKKKGVKCIGCSAGGSSCCCDGKGSEASEEKCSCGCSSEE